MFKLMLLVFGPWIFVFYLFLPVYIIFQEIKPNETNVCEITVSLTIKVFYELLFDRFHLDYEIYVIFVETWRLLEFLSYAMQTARLFILQLKKKTKNVDECIFNTVQTHFTKRVNKA